MQPRAARERSSTAVGCLSILLDRFGPFWARSWTAFACSWAALGRLRDVLAALGDAPNIVFSFP